MLLLSYSHLSHQIGLETFSEVTQRFTSFLTALSESSTRADDATTAFKQAINSRGEAEMLRREWACHARALLLMLENSPGVTDRIYGTPVLILCGSILQSR